MADLTAIKSSAAKKQPRTYDDAFAHLNIHKDILNKHFFIEPDRRAAFGYRFPYTFVSGTRGYELSIDILIKPFTECIFLASLENMDVTMKKRFPFDLMLTIAPVPVDMKHPPPGSFFACSVSSYEITQEKPMTETLHELLSGEINQKIKSALAKCPDGMIPKVNMVDEEFFVNLLSSHMGHGIPLEKRLQIEQENVEYMARLNQNHSNN